MGKRLKAEPSVYNVKTVRRSPTLYTLGKLPCGINPNRLVYRRSGATWIRGPGQGTREKNMRNESLP